MTASRSPHAVLISTYELGHQPFGLASPAAWLGEAGWTATCVDLAVQKLDEQIIFSADLVAFYLPMHTATRLAAPVIQRIREINPAVHVCAYGLYAPVNHGYLRELGVDTVIGGEFEEPLVALAERLRQNEAGAADPDRGDPLISLTRQQFKTPDRSSLPPLDAYAYLQLPDGGRRTGGYTETTRGCKHLCRHCPIVPVYGGRFRVVQREVVIEDVQRQVDAGAQHITFGDPDFFNGPAHALAIVETLHERFPALTYDVTIKVEHLLKHNRLLPALRDTGCLFVTSAVESFDDRVLERFDKCHTRRDFIEVLTSCRRIGLPLNPTFVAFSMWTTRESYLDFLTTIHELGLMGNVAPVQYAIRLLIPAGSRLLSLPEVQESLGEFDEEALCYGWTHPDPRMDELQRDLFQLVQQSVAAGDRRHETFRKVWALAAQSRAAGQRVKFLDLHHGPPRERIPYLSEPWFC
jgi:radical SAM superfamily enzyme YgiQ (UPF0313 family)